MKKFFFLFGLLLFLRSCDKSDYTDNWGVRHVGCPKIKWRFVFPDNQKYPGSIKNPILYKEKVLFISGNFIYVLDKSTGKLLGSIASGWFLGNSQPYVWKNLLIFNGATRRNEKIIAFNMDTYNKEWEIPFYADFDEMSVVGNSLFLVRDSYLVSVNLTTLKEEKSFPLSFQTKLFEPNTFPQIYLNEKNEFNYVIITYQNEDKRLIKYNMTLDTVVYNEYLYINKNEIDYTYYCKIFGDKIIYDEANKKIKCNDFKTGKRIWNYALNVYGNTLGGIPAFNSNSVVVGTGSNQYLVRLNFKDGKEIWKKEKSNKTFGFSSSTQFYFYENVIYWSGENLYAFNVDNGEPIWQNWEKEQGIKMFGRMIFENNNIYIGATNNSSDGHSAICIETP
jgi:outer membrane protein assembly factor BamB